MGGNVLSVHKVTSTIKIMHQKFIKVKKKFNKIKNKINKTKNRVNYYVMRGSDRTVRM